jgi:hypothetical protein
MYVCMYVCMDGWMDGWMDGCKRESGNPCNTVATCSSKAKTCITSTSTC